ncbi:hypothetical protein [Saccharolobus islandicus]|uniref:hypothetical protein n=1 Tax=Saccharolobus islandicus TaxID=43080 RepID=UPI00036B4FDF|nr:hypothetical protein [Sulfolobus islandicus]
MELEEEILLFLLKRGRVTNKEVFKSLGKTGKEVLEDLYFYGFVKRYDTVKRGVYMYELTEKGRMEAELG